MKILVDINVVLDVLLDRRPWVTHSARLLDAAERKAFTGYVAAHTITTAHYLVAAAAGRTKAATAVTDLLRIFRVVPIEAGDFAQALVFGMPDFEDAVQASGAAKVGADYIATRNGKDFKASPVKARTPGELLALVS